MAEAEGTKEGTEVGTEKGTGGEFKAQFSADLRDHEAFKPYKTISDLGKAHIDLMGKVRDLEGKAGKVTELEGKLANTIPKLADDSTDEEKGVFWASLGVPGTPAEYELPDPVGGKKDAVLDEWARNTFHKAHLNKEQAALMGAEWNQFVPAYNAAMVKMEQDDLKTEMGKMKGELGDKYDAHVEMGKRFFKRVMAVDFDEKTPVNTATLLRFVMKAGILMGEDVSPQGSRGRGDDRPGLNYDKSPK